MKTRNKAWLTVSGVAFMAGFISAYLMEPCGNPWPDVRWQDLVMFVGLLSLSLVAISLVTSKSIPLKEDENDRYKKLGFDREWAQDPIIARRHRVDGKIDTAEALIARDLAAVSFDIAPHHDVASVHEYRGLLHWHRDVTEKLLSIFLLLVFTVFLARAFGFLADFLSGNSHRLEFIRNDVNLAIQVVGFALVIDGVILVGSMTDAPGIRRTLDAVIVVLAGVVVLAAHAAARVAEGHHEDGWFALTLTGVLALAVSILFGVRWVVQHRNLRGLRGDFLTPSQARLLREQERAPEVPTPPDPQHPAPPKPDH